MSPTTITRSFAIFFAILLISTSRTNADLLDGITGGLGFPKILGCISTIVSVPGCIEELLSSALNLKLELIGPACCGALLSVKENCLASYFPTNSALPLTVKDFCELKVQAPTP